MERIFDQLIGRFTDVYYLGCPNITKKNLGGTFEVYLITSLRYSSAIPSTDIRPSAIDWTRV